MTRHAERDFSDLSHRPLVFGTFSGIRQKSTTTATSGLQEAGAALLPP